MVMNAQAISQREFALVGNMPNKDSEASKYTVVPIVPGTLSPSAGHENLTDQGRRGIDAATFGVYEGVGSANITLTGNLRLARVPTSSTDKPQKSDFGILAANILGVAADYPVKQYGVVSNHVAQSHFMTLGETDRYLTVKHCIRAREQTYATPNSWATGNTYNIDDTARHDSKDYACIKAKGAVSAAGDAPGSTGGREYWEEITGGITHVYNACRVSELKLTIDPSAQEGLISYTATLVGRDREIRHYAPKNALLEVDITEPVPAWKAQCITEFGGMDTVAQEVLSAEFTITRSTEQFHSLRGNRQYEDLFLSPLEFTCSAVLNYVIGSEDQDVFEEYKRKEQGFFALIIRDDDPGDLTTSEDENSRIVAIGAMQCDMGGEMITLDTSNVNARTTLAIQGITSDKKPSSVPDGRRAAYGIGATMRGTQLPSGWTPADWETESLPAEPTPVMIRISEGGGNYTTDNIARYFDEGKTRT